MKVGGVSYRTIWDNGDGSVGIIDQTRLPHAFEALTLRTLADAAHAIKIMQVRGAPLIGVTAAYGVCLALNADASDAGLEGACATLAATRPTAVNLAWALREMQKSLSHVPASERVAAAYAKAAQMAEHDVETCRLIGRHGQAIIADIAARKNGPVNVLTHCNAGWLACVDWGTALSPIYHAHDAGIPIHVWVDETRPRNQGAALTAFELGAHGVPHTIIADNAGGHLMQHGAVDLCIVGCDRLTATGDAANKIGTYLKALAAKDNGIPFYVALPQSTIDWTLSDGVLEIPIEERDEREVTHMTGTVASGEILTVQVTAPGSKAANPAFDVTPARLITGLMTERGVTPASRDGLAQLYPERKETAAA
ncbi:MAG TPA: S-methyl-5-thioribose-1-phosphate isomerase [Geobacterales bacterium]|nr:S-methyl-5-thioribose-1-phosphate isomerase [Geobacterales bacterium]